MKNITSVYSPPFLKNTLISQIGQTATTKQSQQILSENLTLQIIIINISYFKCSSMNHTSRGSSETLSLLKLRIPALNLINWSNGGMKINWSNDPPLGIKPVTTGMVSAPPNH